MCLSSVLKYMNISLLCILSYFLSHFEAPGDPLVDFHPQIRSDYPHSRVLATPLMAYNEMKMQTQCERFRQAVATVSW